jgi:hypothetical protein
MKRSEMAWIAWDTTSVTCRENLISLDFFANFLALSIDIFSGIAECKHLCQDKKLGGLGGNPKNKINRFFFCHFLCGQKVTKKPTTNAKSDLIPRTNQPPLDPNQSDFTPFVDTHRTLSHSIWSY